jgi:hypothetical protein
MTPRSHRSWAGPPGEGRPVGYPGSVAGERRRPAALSPDRTVMENPSIGPQIRRCPTPAPEGSAHAGRPSVSSRPASRHQTTADRPKRACQSRSLRDACIANRKYQETRGLELAGGGHAVGVTRRPESSPSLILRPTVGHAVQSRSASSSSRSRSLHASISRLINVTCGAETLFVGRGSGSTTAMVAALRRRFDTSPARSWRLTRAQARGRVLSPPGGRVSVRAASPSHCGRACGPCHGRYAARRRSRAPCHRARRV